MIRKLAVVTKGAILMAKSVGKGVHVVAKHTRLAEQILKNGYKIILTGILIKETFTSRKIKGVTTPKKKLTPHNQ